ncbi:MAG TPA: hypothetical protein VFZ77_17730 [Acidimicrobiales bacterium]
METFVVRAWRSHAGEEPADDGDEDLRGVVEHVASGTSTPFRDVDQLITFLRSAPGGHAGG